MATDLKVIQDSVGVWDLSLNDDGDLDTVDSFDTELVYALLGEQRAAESEVPISANRRGWIGNTGNDFENGSKIWLYSQSRLTRTVMNAVQNTALLSLSYFVSSGLLKAVEAKVFLSNGNVILQINLIRFESRVETRLFTLWENTGAN